MIQNNFFLKTPRRNVGHKLSAAVSEDLNWVFPSLLVKLIKISHSPPISSPRTVQLFKKLEIDPKFQASYNFVGKHNLLTPPFISSAYNCQSKTCESEPPQLGFRVLLVQRQKAHCHRASWCDGDLFMNYRYPNPIERNSSSVRPSVTFFTHPNSEHFMCIFNR